jgi:hypothetical protein
VRIHVEHRGQPGPASCLLVVLLLAGSPSAM